MFAIASAPHGETTRPERACMHGCIRACRRVGGRYGICASTSAGCPSKKYGCVSPSGFTPPGANLRAANRTLSPHAVPNQTVEVAKTEASALIALHSAMGRLVEYRRYEQSRRKRCDTRSRCTDRWCGVASSRRGESRRGPARSARSRGRLVQAAHSPSPPARNTSQGCVLAVDSRMLRVELACVPCVRRRSRHRIAVR